MFYPLLFKPIFQERIWGGRSLERLYAKPLPPGKVIGESWEICDRPEAQSVVANGPLNGKTLHWLVQNHGPALLGSARAPSGRFPLLVKILDAEDKLSLQVHPPAAKAAQFNGEPKTEMWHIAEAKPGAELYVGLRSGVTRGEFEARIRSGTVAECFHRVQVRSGDTMFLPSGRVHAIGAGLVIFEIQQNSDTTFRVFDWNRVDAQGKPRPLHVEESLECIDFADFEPRPIGSSPEPRGRGMTAQRLVRDPLFSVEKFEAVEGSTLELPLAACAIVAIAAGKIQIDGSPGVELSPGQFVLLPAASKTAKLQALTEAQFLVSTPGQ